MLYRLNWLTLLNIIINRNFQSSVGFIKYYFSSIIINIINIHGLLLIEILDR